MKKPKLTVIIPSYNQGNFINRSLMSIKKQNYKGELEIIVSDGGSTDNTITILKKFEDIIWWSEPDDGFASAVNKALEVASGDVIAIQSCDDYYLPNTFNVSVNKLINDEELALVTANDIYLMEDYKSFSKSLVFNHEITPRNLLTYKNIPQHCTFVKKEYINKVGGVRDLSNANGIDHLADTDLWYRILHFGKGLFLPRYSAVYQYHDNQRANSIEIDRYEIFEKMINLCENDSFYSDKFKFNTFEKEILLKYYKSTITKEYKDLYNSFQENYKKIPIDLKLKIIDLLFSDLKTLDKIKKHIKYNTFFNKTVMWFKHKITKKINAKNEIDINWWQK
jgi:glycosyltransferase involved in cell wall biosynthesis